MWGRANIAFDGATGDVEDGACNQKETIVVGAQ
jgi:hypothetical protein